VESKLDLTSWRTSVKQGRHSAIGLVERIDYEGKLFRLVLGRDAGETITDHFLEQLVVHELLHIAIYPVKVMVLAEKELMGEHIHSAEHGLINILEVLLCPPKESNGPNS